MPRMLLCLLVTLAGGLAAQHVASLNGSVPTNRRLTLLYAIDFGAGGSYSLACGLQTGATSGLVVRLIDIDGLAGSAVANPTSVDEAIITGAGTANAALSGSYTGVRRFAVEIETASGSTASDYSGNLTSSAGLITFIKQEQFILSATGLKTQVGHFAFWNGAVPSATNVPVGLELEFGPVSQTVFVRFEGIGNVQKLELIDTTGGSATVLATFTSPSAGDVTAVPLTHSGRVTLRVNALGLLGSANTAAWALTVPSTISVKRPGQTDNDRDIENGCSTGTRHGALWLIPAGCAALVLRRRRARSSVYR